MKHHTYNQFQGVWWGAIVGQEASERASVDSDTWRQKRQKIAKIILESEELAEDDLALGVLIAQMLDFDEEIAEQNQVNNLTDSWSSSTLTAKNSIETSSDREAGTKLLYDDNLLSLLPLIIFRHDHQKLLSQIIDRVNLKSASRLENSNMREDILLWSHLVTFVFNNGFQPRQKNLLLASSKMLDNMDVKETWLTKRLKLVVRAAHSGVGLHQLSKKISSGDNIRQIAIALAWYCFITTPNDYQLSVQRSLNLAPDLAWLTAALTATLSGAYNGLTGIPWSWRSKIAHHPNFARENEILLKLFKKWLGIYSINSHDYDYELELGAVAMPRIIQPRKILKIISQ